MFLRPAREDVFCRTVEGHGQGVFGRGHSHDFLTFGSMGYASSIALGIVSQGELGKIRTKKVATCRHNS